MQDPDVCMVATWHEACISSGALRGALQFSPRIQELPSSLRDQSLGISCAKNDADLKRQGDSWQCKGVPGCVAVAWHTCTAVALPTRRERQHIVRRLQASENQISSSLTSMPQRASTCRDRLGLAYALCAGAASAFHECHPSQRHQHKGCHFRGAVLAQRVPFKDSGSKTVLGMVFGTRFLKYAVNELSGMWMVKLSGS